MSDYVQSERSYQSELMKIGKSNEDIILDWLKKSPEAKAIIDFREFRLAQRIDVDFGIESIDGDIQLAEIKSDKMISESGNLFFETQRINHFAENHWAYLGWGWRSPAQKLIIRNPVSGDAFVFQFQKLRIRVGELVSQRHYRLTTVYTDPVKTTFGLLIQLSKIKPLYEKYFVPGGAA